MTKHGPHTLCRNGFSMDFAHDIRRKGFATTTAPTNTARMLAGAITLGMVGAVALGALSFGAYMVGRVGLAPQVERLAQALNGDPSAVHVLRWTDSRGESFVLDSGLTPSDCVREARRVIRDGLATRDGLTCDAE